MSEHIYWAKHAPIDRLPLEIVGGGTDRELSEQGLEWARNMAIGFKAAIDSGEIVNPAPNIYTSTMRRAKVTAEIVAEACGLDVVYLDLLRAQHFGALEGKTVQELEADPELARHLYGNIDVQDRFSARAPGGESQEDAWNRVTTVRRTFKPFTRNPIVITHGSMLNPVIGTLRGLRNYDWDNQNQNFAGFIIDDTGNALDTIRIERRTLRG